MDYTFRQLREKKIQDSFNNKNLMSLDLIA